VIVFDWIADPESLPAIYFTLFFVLLN
jgi:hypothetical protein